MPLFGSTLPDFPWDTLTEIRVKAAAYPEGAIDLTIGTPVDPIPAVIQNALVDSADSPGYPPNLGSAQWNKVMREFLANQHRVRAAELLIFPALGSKEMVALLPAMLGFGVEHCVAYPSISYPTYEVGAKLAGAQQVKIDPESNPDSWPTNISLLWLNSPGNPDGHVLDVLQLRKIVAWARRNNTIVVSDECYSTLPWEVDSVPSLLSDEVCDGNADNLILLYSFSKQSNMAGYRAAFVAGDAKLLHPVTEIRKHAGFMMSAPVQEAMIAAATNPEHIVEQREVYRRRRNILLAAVQKFGLRNDPLNRAGLYLWVDDPKGDRRAADLVQDFAELGIIVTPGSFYGEDGVKFVRISLTASDEEIEAAAQRLKSAVGSGK
ncbi:MAG: succinyldiaminopimelate transaminase [Arcanobacterium sp.]|nr:succinyldiaminopimelate transaminase [Arcanobacterium sp.]